MPNQNPNPNPRTQMASEALSSSSGSLTPYADESASASSPTSSLLLPWTPRENKAFELVLSNHTLRQDTARNPDSDIWDDIAASLPGRSPASVRAHYEALLHDIRAIDAGLIPLPAYYQQSLVQPAPLPQSPASASTSADAANGAPATAGHGGSRSKKDANGSNSKSSLSKSADLDRRKGIPWTEEEHKSFLLGLAEFGKGDWRSISRNFVRTRTPTQVASHAQKYFIRLNSMKKDRRRSSIHDITSVNGDVVQTNHGPITGQGVQAHISRNPAPRFTEGNAFTAAVGQPVMASTVGTPVLISPAGYNGPMVSGAPLARPIMPGPPVGILPVPYTVGQPMPPS